VVSLCAVIICHSTSLLWPPLRQLHPLQSTLCPLCLLPSSCLWLSFYLHLHPCPLPWIHPRDSPTNRLPCSQVPPSFSSHSIRASGHAPEKPCFLSPLFSILYPRLTPSQPSSLPSTPRFIYLDPSQHLAPPHQTHSTQRVGSRRPHGSLPHPLCPQP